MRCYVPAKSQAKETDAMATATETLKNFVDGELVDPADGRTSRRAQPGDRRGDRAGARVQRGGRRPRRQGGEHGLRDVGAHDPGRARDGAARARRPHRGARRRARRARVGQRGQAAGRGQGGRDRHDGRSPPVLRRRGAHARGQGERRVPRGLHLDDPARAGRRGRPDRAVELPADDGRLEDRARRSPRAARSSSSPRRRPRSRR